MISKGNLKKIKIKVRFEIYKFNLEYIFDLWSMLFAYFILRIPFPNIDNIDLFII